MLNRFYTSILIVPLLLLMAFVPGDDVQAPIVADDALGLWLSENGQEKIRIFKKGDRYYGKIEWMQKGFDENGRPLKDVLNPDPALRDQPYLGLMILKDFVYKGNGVFREGIVYDAGGGKEYSGMITLVDKNTAKVRGYIGIPLIGKTELTTKVIE